MAAVGTSCIDELEEAVQSHSAEKRVETLRRITDFFLGEADRLNEQQIGVFDDVLDKLIQRIENKALAELSSRLAPVENAPIEVIRRLSRNDEISIAGPVLAQSSRLTAADLIEVAKTKGQSHLLAISGRTQIEEQVTDVLLSCGDREVANRLASNSGARFSEMGFEALVKAGEADASLAEKVGPRLDLPIRLLRELLLKATEAVQSRLLALSTPENQNEIRRVLGAICSEVSQEVTKPRDFTAALELTRLMQEKGELNEAALFEFACGQKYEEMVAALSILCGVSIEIIKPVMKAAKSDGLLIPCKAADLKWTTVSDILKNRFAHHTLTDQELSECKANFFSLTKPTAQRALRFWAVRSGTANKSSLMAS